MVGPRAILAACALSFALPAAAIAGWGSPETLPDGSPNGVSLQPGGNGLVMGFPATGPSRLRLAERPPGGPVGSPEDFGGTIGYGPGSDLPLITLDGSGNALISERNDHEIVYRTADGTYSAVQDLGVGKYPKLVSMAPTGEAMVGLNASPSGPVQVAFRPAGPTALVDMDPGHIENFDDSGTLVGLLLQANGGAIVLWLDGNTLMQSVRPSGSASFTTPTEVLQAPGPDARKAGVRFDGDPSGWAMLAWQASSTSGGAFDRAVGTVRSPDGSFPAGQVLGTETSIANPTPAVTASGDGIVAWRQAGTRTPPAGCFSSAVYAAMQHQGIWAATQAITPDTETDVSITGFANSALSSGEEVAVPWILIHRDPCNDFAGELRSLKVRHYRSSATGLTDRGTTELVAPVHAFPLVDDWAMEPGGRILSSFSSGGGHYLNDFDGVTPGPDGGDPDPDPTPTPTPTPTATAPPGTTPGPAPPGPPPPVILPIVPKHFVTIPPIDPKALDFEMTCPPDETCAARAWAYYVLTGKHAPWIKGAPSGSSAARKKRRILLAQGALTLKAGQKGRLKLKPSKTGKKALRLGRKLKIELKLQVSSRGRTGTDTFKTSIKARKKKGRTGSR